MSNPNPTTGGPPLRALAMVLIALAIVFAGLGAMSLSNSDVASADSAEPTTTTTTAPIPATAAAITTTSTVAPTTPTTTTPAPTTTTTTTTPAASDRGVAVRVLNNSLVSGLAARTASELSADGWTNVSTGNYSGTNLTSTTVYYGTGAGDKAAATEIAGQVGGTIAPKSGDTSPGVTVILAGR